MIETPVIEKHGVSSAQLLLVAGAALILALVGVRVYPFLVSFAVAGAFLATVKAVTFVCWAAVFTLPVAAVVRRLIR